MRMLINGNPTEPQELLTAFHTYYQYLECLVMEATDSTVLTQLGDELDEYVNLVTRVSLQAYCNININLIYQQHSALFPVKELSIIHTSLGIMQTYVCIKYQEALDLSHHGRPKIIKTIYTGNHGHLHISINPNFLHWVYSHRMVLGIAYFLGVYRDTV